MDEEQKGIKARIRRRRDGDAGDTEEHTEMVVNLTDEADEDKDGGEE